MKEEIENSLIVEFMGAKKYYHHPKDNIDNEQTWYFDNNPNKEFYTNELQYHISWDWLMPVRDKFYKIKLDPECEYGIKADYQRYCDKIAYACAYEDVGLVCSVLTEAIKWYNKKIL